MTTRTDMVPQQSPSGGGGEDGAVIDVAKEMAL